MKTQLNYVPSESVENKKKYMIMTRIEFDDLIF